MKAKNLTINLTVLALVFGMALFLFGALGLSEITGGVILFFWMFAIGYFGGKIVANL